MFYKKGIKKNSAKSMFNFLNEHYRYYTLNSWNGLKSIANNVKLYNLNLDGDYSNILDLIFTDYSPLIDDINFAIEEFENTHKGYVLGFNGRSSGYLVMYNEKGATSILPDWIEDCDDYEEYKEKAKYYDGGVKYTLHTLKQYVNLVQDFDKLCDELRNIVNEYVKDPSLYEEEEEV